MCGVCSRATEYMQVWSGSFIRVMHLCAITHQPLYEPWGYHFFAPSRTPFFVCRDTHSSLAPTTCPIHSLALAVLSFDLPTHLLSIRCPTRFENCVDHLILFSPRSTLETSYQSTKEEGDRLTDACASQRQTNGQIPNISPVRCGAVRTRFF